MSGSSAATEAAEALATYDVGSVERLEPAGGTAGRTWKVSATTGEYFLRRRGPRTSGEARLRFDHGLRARLLGRGVATTAALPNRAGSQWSVRSDGVYELYPFISGRTARPDSLVDAEAAGRALARYHLAARGYLPSVGSEVVAQYTSIGFSRATSDRLDDPDLLRGNLEATAALARTQMGRASVARCVERAEAMAEVYGGASYEGLTGWVLHGDFTPANLIWSSPATLPHAPPYRSLGGAGEAEEVFIFDLDWALPGARCRDVADGLYFFGTRPRRLDASSIWSLTEAAEFEPRRCVGFLDAYQSVSRLSEAELIAIPSAFAGRWLSIRLEGMAKVDEPDRFRFFSRNGDVEAPVAWLDAHWQELLSRLD